MNTKTKTILVVDDEEDVLWAMKNVLETMGRSIRVIPARNGKEALTILAGQQIDLVLTDILMPGITGLDLLVMVKNQFPGLPVVVMTGLPSAQHKREVLLGGGVYFLKKPFNSDKLQKTVGEILRESGHFRGVLRTLGMGDVIQIKCMSCVTAALRVDEGMRRGIIFFQRGEITHALCGELEGEEALFEIMDFEQGHLETMIGAEQPERTIFSPYGALLLKGTQLSENRRRNLLIDPPEPAGLHEPEQSDPWNIRIGSQVPVGILSGIKSIPGYRAAAVIAAGGAILARHSTMNDLDLDRAGRIYANFFFDTREATNRIGLETCYETAIETDKGMIILGGEAGPDVKAKLVFALFDATANPTRGQREVNRAVARLSNARPIS